MSQNDILSRRDGESELSYLYRLGMSKDAGILDLTWGEVAEAINKEFRDPGQEYGESTYRKKFANIRQFKEEFGDELINPDEKELIELRRELEKEKVKVRDERNEYKRLIREEARKESYQEQFIRSIENAAKKYSLEYDKYADNKVCSSGAYMIVPLFDLHTGIEINNSWNTFNEDVLKYRLDHYLDRIFEIQKRHLCSDVYVVCSELISGLIHQNLRLQNNQDVIDQFLMVMDYICEFLEHLSYRFAHVNVYVAPGNHSRINPKKDQDLAHENFDNLVIPFLRAKMQNFDNIHCFENDIEQSMAVFPVFNINVCAVHGDRDSFENVADRINKFLRTRIDLIICGHKHTNQMRTDGDVKVVQSGCISGSDEYALNNRMRNRPEQSVCIITEQEGLDCIYDIKF